MRVKLRALTQRRSGEVACSRRLLANGPDEVPGCSTRQRDRPYFTTRAAACAVEADAASDVLIANHTSDTATEQVAAVLGPATAGGAMLHVTLGGVAAYNGATQPPSNASSDGAQAAMRRRNAELCTAYGNPILTRTQVDQLARLAGADATLLLDVDVFADEPVSRPGSPVGPASATPQAGSLTVVDSAGGPAASRPDTLHVRCGDRGATIVITGIDWQSWGPPNGCGMNPTVPPNPGFAARLGSTSYWAGGSRELPGERPVRRASDLNRY